MTINRIAKGGRYFYADNDKLEALFRRKNMNGDTIEVVKEGSEESVKIKVWKWPEGTGGRKDPKGNMSAEDWKKGDKITAKSCKKN